MEEITVKTWDGKNYLKLKEDSIVVFQLKKERIIPISQIISFEIKDPKSKMRPGMIKIQLGGSPDSFVKVTSFFTVGNSGNVEFPHSYEYLDAAHKIKDYIMQYTAKGRSSAGLVSATDEIRKFKELLDMGAITQEEYDAKKQQLLSMEVRL